jgi:hypothetical protein
VTGGDFGIVLVRPDVRLARYFGTELTIDHDYKRGLLCQAKIFRRNSRWGRLTPKQQRNLRGKLNYLALVLYRYVDQAGERRHLAPFAWQLPHGATVKQMNDRLALDAFPELQESSQILKNLIHNKIGTDDKSAIARHILPPVRPSFEIKIHWREGDDPGGTMRVEQENTEQVRQQVVVRAARGTDSHARKTWNNFGTLEGDDWRPEQP